MNHPPPGKIAATKERLKYAKYFLWKLVHELRHPRATYSQHHEDVVLGALLGKVTAFIDIGANDGLTFSNSYLFAQKGAYGLCFEPVLANCRKAKLHHLFHSRVKCIQEGISDSEGVQRIAVRGWEGLDSSLLLSSDSTEKPATQAIHLRRLDYWVKRLPRFLTVDLVSLDVEGCELNVLRGIDFGRFQTRCFVIETDKVAVEEINAILAPHGYAAMLTNGLNTFWFPKDAAHAVPLNLICAQFSEYRMLPGGPAY